MNISRINLLRGMASGPIYQPIVRDPEDVLSAVPFVPPEIPEEFYEELISLSSGKWGKSENFLPGMAFPIEPEIDEELDLDIEEGPIGFV